MAFSKRKVGAVLLGVLCMTIPSVSVWAAGVPVSNTGGFGAPGLSTSNSAVPSANFCLGSPSACSDDIYTVDINSQVFLSGSTRTYVYTVTVDTANTYSCTGGGTCTSPGTLTSPPSTFSLSTISIGSPNFDLVSFGPDAGFGVVTGGTSIGTNLSSASLGSSSLQFKPASLGVGKTLEVYAQASQGPFFTSGSTQDGGNIAGGLVVAPTPEPASIALLGSGFVLLGGVLRRRLHRKAT